MIRHPLVSTILTAPERSRVDAVGVGLYDTLHRDSIDEVTRDVRHRGVGAILVSVKCRPGGGGVPAPPRVGAFVRNYPRGRAVALLTEADRHAPAALLSLG